MSNTYSDKDPADVRRYEADMAGVLPAGATIEEATAALTGLTAPEGVSPLFGIVSGEPTVVYAWATGGADATTGRITWTMTTSGGETIQRSAFVPIKER